MGRFFLQRFNQLRAVQIHVNALFRKCVGGGFTLKTHRGKFSQFIVQLKKSRAIYILQ